MKVSAKTLHIVILNAFFAVTWAASLPADAVIPKEKNAVPIKDTLCSENATLNISEVCPTILGTTIDSSDSTLKDFTNLCDHAAYLLHKLCEYTQSDSKLGTDIAANVTTLLSQKVTDGGGQFCGDLRQSGKAWKIEIGFRSCVDNCMLENDAIKPLCRFVQWSWKFLPDHTKGPQAQSNTQQNADSQTPAEIKPGKNDEQTQATAKSSGIKPEGVPLESQGSKPEGVPLESQGSNQPAIQEPEPPKSEKPAPVAKEQEVKNSPPKDTLLGAGTDNDQKGNPSAKDTNPPSPPEVSDPPNSQLNRPSDRVDGENFDIDKPLVNLPESPAGNGQTTNPDEDAKTNQDLTKNDNDDDTLPDADNPVIGEDLSPQKQPSPDQKNEKESKADTDDEDGGDNAMNEDDDETEVKKEPKWPKPNFQSKEVLTGTMDEYSEAEDSHFFVFFFIATFICIIFYLIYQNKRKIIAMALEGKKGRHSGRRRPTSASYQKLDNKLDEVMASSPPPSKTHVIY